jgi:peptidyl-prolyl cis-trans isomerase D
MPFFEKIRSQTDSALARAFFVVIVLVFVFWGVGVNSGQRTQVVAEVNGESIYYTDVQKIMRRMQRNESLNEDEVIQLRTEAIEELIKQTALQTYTQDMGLAVSDTEISLQLLEIDAFKGPDGKFDAELYDQILSREAYSKTIFEEQQREGIRIQKLQNLLVDSIIITDREVDEQFRKTTTTIDVEWVHVTEDTVVPFLNISDSDIDAFVSSDGVAIEERYNNDKSRLYDLPERVVYESVRIPKASDAEPSVIESSKSQLLEIRQGIESGGNMQELAVEKGLAYGNPSLPTTANQLPENISTALFAVENNTILDVLETDDALVLYRVIERKSAEQKTLDDVKRDIATQILQEQRKSQESQKVAEQILSAYQNPLSDTFQNMLATYKLETRNQKDLRLANPEIPSLRDAEELTQQLQMVDKAGVLPKIYASTDGWIVAKIVNYSQDSNPEMQAMLKQYIRSQMQNERTQIAINSYVQEIVNNSDVTRIPLQ